MELRSKSGSSFPTLRSHSVSADTRIFRKSRVTEARWSKKHKIIESHTKKIYLPVELCVLYHSLANESLDIGMSQTFLSPTFFPRQLGFIEFMRAVGVAADEAILGELLGSFLLYIFVLPPL